MPITDAPHAVIHGHPIPLTEQPRYITDSRVLGRRIERFSTANPTHISAMVNVLNFAGSFKGSQDERQAVTVDRAMIERNPQPFMQVMGRGQEGLALFPRTPIEITSSGNRLYFDFGSSQRTTIALNISNHAHPIASITYENGSGREKPLNPTNPVVLAQLAELTRALLIAQAENPVLQTNEKLRAQFILQLQAWTDSPEVKTLPVLTEEQIGLERFPL